ncbi:MAG: hypothetical protein ACOY45_09580 [Pseudomonadota bacterium]
MQTDLPDIYRTDVVATLYRPMRSGDWELRQANMVLCPGYWSAPQLVNGMTALVRGGETWMSITPMEIESQQIGVSQARGHVVIFGLGMGWSAAASALRDEVTEVTVVERDPDVLAIHHTLDLFARLPGGVGEKVRVEQGDAYSWRTSRTVDVLMPDIWLPLVSDGRVDEVRRMQANVQARLVYFWGQEMEIARHAVAACRDLDDGSIRAMIDDFGLPLIGPDTPDYANRLQAAAQRWMRGRWLPGSTPPFG